MNLDPSIEKVRRRYYLCRPITAKEKEELITFCTLDPIRQLWYCMDRRRLMQWVSANSPAPKTAIEPVESKPIEAIKNIPNSAPTPVTTQNAGHAIIFSEFCLKLVDWGYALEKAGYSETTARLYHKDAVDFMRWTLRSRQTLPTTIDTKLLESYEENLISKKTGERTITRVKSSVKKFIAFLESPKVKKGSTKG